VDRELLEPSIREPAEHTDVSAYPQHASAVFRHAVDLASDVDPRERDLARPGVVQLVESDLRADPDGSTSVLEERPHIVCAGLGLGQERGEHRPAALRWPSSAERVEAHQSPVRRYPIAALVRFKKIVNVGARQPVVNAVRGESVSVESG
jgi:hypothetical protein